MTRSSWALLSFYGLRGGIVGIVSRDDLQHRRGVCDAARHRSGNVGKEAQRRDTRAAREAHRRPNSNERLVRARPANRVARVGPQSHFAQIGGDGGRGSAGRAGGHTIELVRILRVPGSTEFTVSYGLNANSAIFDFANTIAPASLIRLT